MQWIYSMKWEIYTYTWLLCYTHAKKTTLCINIYFKNMGFPCKYIKTKKFSSQWNPNSKKINIWNTNLYLFIPYHIERVLKNNISLP